MVERVSRRRVLGLGLMAATLAACAEPGRPEPAPPASGRAQAAPGTPPASRGAPDASPASGGAPAPPRPGAVEVARAGSGRAEVALTFHGAGELGLARQVLELLRQRGAGVTVLAVGTWLAASPDAARMVLDLGHELGNHTWSHPALSGYAAEPMFAEIQRCRDKLVALTGSPGAFFRQSQGQHATAAELAQAGRAGYARVLSYDVDSLDWQDPGPAAIRSAVTAARAGSVVSLHLGHPGTLAALPGVLDDLARRGLTPVTATELLR